MIAATELHAAANAALDAMRAAGFEHSQVHASCTDLTELNAADNEPSLLRSTETRKLTLLGIVDQRMASTELVDFAPSAIAAQARALFADARSAPQDEANAVSSGQRGALQQGPQEADEDALVASLSEVLQHRREAASRFTVREAVASHRLQRFHWLTTGGSDIGGAVGWYDLMAMGAAREGGKTGSLTYTGGSTHDLRSAPAPEQFGIGEMMQFAQKQVDTHPFGEKFEGDIVLMPNAVANLMAWLLGQLGDMQLVAGSSLYRDQVGQRIASDALTLRSWFDAPGIAGVSADGFVTPPVTVVENGVLRTLLPSLYGSRKTGIAHVPSPVSGWEMAAGTTPLAQLMSGVKRGALVGRLSMGAPAANGNFSGVIKNSFALENGEVGHALSETMISGNMAQMLRSIVGASRELRDGQGWRLPWLRVSGLRFS